MIGRASNAKFLSKHTHSQKNQIQIPIMNLCIENLSNIILYIRTLETLFGIRQFGLLEDCFKFPESLVL
jgi:hypothetical protein